MTSRGIEGAPVWKLSAQLGADQVSDPWALRIDPCRGQAVSCPVAGGVAVPSAAFAARSGHSNRAVAYQSARCHHDLVKEQSSLGWARRPLVGLVTIRDCVGR